MTTTNSPALIGPDELQRLLSEEPDTQILDVRTSGEFEAQHIPGAHNVPLDLFSEHLSDLVNIDNPVVLVCRSGARSTQAHERLSKAGEQTLHMLEGGLNSWLAADGDIVRGETSRWAMDRQVRLVAGALTMTGIAASVVVPQTKWLSGAIGAGLFYSAVSNTCTMAAVLSKLPYNRSNNPNVQAVLAELNRKTTRK